MRKLGSAVSGGMILALAACAAAPPMLPADHNGPPILPVDHNGPPIRPVDPPPPPILTADMARMSETSRVLASDEMLGRAPAGPAEQKVIDYLISQFRDAGLEPAGENGGWTQTVPMIKTQLAVPANGSVKVGGKVRALKWGEDYSLNTARETNDASIADAPMVFVGYGVSAPERGWDDFKGADLKGKVAVFLVNDPDFEAAAGDEAAGVFGGAAMTYYGRWTYKFEEAARQGAAGALIIHQTDAAGYGWNVAGRGGKGENYGLPLAAGAPPPPLLQGWIQGPVAADLLKSAGLDLAALKRAARRRDFRPVEMKARMTVKAPVTVERVLSRNVLGKLTGSRYPDEVVSFGGHWDAFGVGAPDAQGRTIRPGARDDALGIAAMLEIARMFTSRPRPQRSLLFAAWTGEEQLLLGSEHYALNPLTPLSNMVANLTLDTLQTQGAVTDVVLIGKGQSEMEHLLAQEAARQGRTVSDEGRPERGLFYRADHFSFAKRGVPVLLNMALAGAHTMKVGGRAAGDKWLEEFTANCYHQPCDDWSPDWNLEGAQQEADLFFAIGERLANSRYWPRWLPTSEFAKLRPDKNLEQRQ